MNRTTVVLHAPKPNDEFPMDLEKEMKTLWTKKKYIPKQFFSSNNESCADLEIDQNATHMARTFFNERFFLH